MIKLICFLSIIAYISSASVTKREEYNTDPLLALTNQVNANRDQSSVPSNNSPVYSQNGYPTYSSSYSSPVASNQNLQSNNYGSQPDANQAYVDNVASATSNLQNSQSNNPYQNNQGLYYYYYPVQDKNKDINYQASPSNQYTSSIVQPQSNDDQSNQNNANLANNQQMSNSANNIAGHDLNYGAQDLAYTASALNENNGNSNGQSSSSNYAESQLNNLANSLNQYGFGSNSNGPNPFSSQLANQFSGLNNLGGLVQGFGEAFGGSSIQPSSVPFVNDPAFASAMASQFGSFSPVATSQSGSGSSSGPFSQIYQQAAQMYQGLFNGGNSASQPQFAASQQHPSYEPSTGGSGSGFRAKYGTIGTLMMPLIALAGLSLLIPTVTSLSTASRKKRSAEDDFNLRQAGLGNYFERIDRYYKNYNNAIDEECLNRIICEIGGAVSIVKGKEAFFDFIESMMPQGWMVNGSKASIFKNSALNENNAKCIKYKCSFKNRP